MQKNQIRIGIIALLIATLFGTAYYVQRKNKSHADFLPSGLTGGNVYVPTNLRITTSWNTNIMAADETIHWSPSLNAATYNLYRYGNLINSGLTGTSYLLPTNQINGSMTYTLTSVDVNNKESIPSNPIALVFAANPAAPPNWTNAASAPVPTELSAIPEWNAGAPRVWLAWRGSSKASAYSVYRDGIKVGSGLWGLNYEDAAVQAGKSYSYTVSAEKSYYPGALDSVQSLAVTVTTIGNAPASLSQKVIVTGVRKNDDSATVFFDPVPGAVDYRIYKVGHPEYAKYAGSRKGPTPEAPYSIELNNLDTVSGNDVVVEAVDKFGPFQTMDGYIGPGTAWPDGTTHFTNNGQGDPSNLPNAIASSDVFHLSAQPKVLSGSQQFLDNFRNSQPLVPVPSASINPAITSAQADPYAGVSQHQNLNWLITDYRGDHVNDQVFIMSNHLMDTTYDGPGADAFPFSHNNNASMVMSPKSSVDISGGKIAHFSEEVDAHLTSRRFLDMIVTQSGQPLLRADPSKLELNQGSSLTAAANEVVYEILPSSFALIQFTGKDATGNLIVNNLPQPSFANGVDPTCSRSCGHQFVDIAGDNGTQQDLDKRHIFDMYISQTHIKVYENGKLYDDTDLAKPLTYSQLQMNFTHEVYHTANEINEQKDGSTRNSYFYDYRPFSDERHWDNMGQEVLASWTQAVPTIEPIVAPQFVSGQPTPAPTMSLSGGLCLNLRLSNLPNGTSVNPSISVKILDSAGTAVAVTTGQSLASGSINLTDPTFLSLLNDLSTYSIVVKPTGYLAEQLNNATHLLTSCQSLPVAFIPGDMLDSNHLGLAELVTLIRAFNGSGNSETSATYPAGPKIGDIVSFIRAFNQSVSISSFAFSQPTMTVGVGASVNWLNNETTAIMHTITSTDGTGFDSGFISAGTSYSKTFSQAGTYTYHCSRHPSMTGKVIVQ